MAALADPRPPPRDCPLERRTPAASLRSEKAGAWRVSLASLAAFARCCVCPGRCAVRWECPLRAGADRGHVARCARLVPGLSSVKGERRVHTLFQFGLRIKRRETCGARPALRVREPQGSRRGVRALRPDRQGASQDWGEDTRGCRRRPPSGWAACASVGIQRSGWRLWGVSRSLSSCSVRPQGNTQLKVLVESEIRELSGRVSGVSGSSWTGGGTDSAPAGRRHAALRPSLRPAPSTLSPPPSAPRPSVPCRPAAPAPQPATCRRPCGIQPVGQVGVSMRSSGRQQPQGTAPDGSRDRPAGQVDPVRFGLGGTRTCDDAVGKDRKWNHLHVFVNMADGDGRDLSSCLCICLCHSPRRVQGREVALRVPLLSSPSRAWPSASLPFFLRLSLPSVCLLGATPLLVVALFIKPGNGGETGEAPRLQGPG